MRNILWSLVEHVLVRLFLDIIRQGNVSRRTVAANIVAVFVLNTEQCPDTATNDFRQADAESNHGRGLELMDVDDVKDPVEAKDRVDDHGCIIPPYLLVSQLVAQELVFRRRYTQTYGMSVFEAALRWQSTYSSP